METGLVAVAVSHIAAAVRAYGPAAIEQVVDVAEDHTADATVRAGRELLLRVLRRGESTAPVIEALRDLVQDPADEDVMAALRVQLRKAMATDPQLADEVGEVLRDRAPGQATEHHTLPVQRDVGIVVSGDAVLGDKMIGREVMGSSDGGESRRW